jgi:hypothetical protein
MKSTPETKLPNVKGECVDEIRERNAKTADISTIRNQLQSYMSVISSGFHKGKILMLMVL